LYNVIIVFIQYASMIKQLLLL